MHKSAAKAQKRSATKATALTAKPQTTKRKSTRLTQAAKPRRTHSTLTSKPHKNTKPRLSPPTLAQTARFRTATVPPTTRPISTAAAKVAKSLAAPLLTQSRRGYMNPDFHGIDYSPTGRPIHRATTILCVRKGPEVVMIGDGQVSLGPTVVKPNARKIRRIGTNNDVIVGFAGSTADAFTLLGLLENQLEQHPGQLLRASVETAKLWRTDKMSRHLEAMLIASDENISLCISGNGDVIESHDGLLGIGSGSTYALAAARALIDIDSMDSMAIAKKAMNIAADICVYTNHNFVIDSILVKPVEGSETGLSTAVQPAHPNDTPAYSRPTPVKM